MTPVVRVVNFVAGVSAIASAAADFKVAQGHSFYYPFGVVIFIIGIGPIVAAFSDAPKITPGE